MRKTCNTKGYHDSRICPTKIKQVNKNSIVQNVECVLNQGTKASHLDAQNLYFSGISIQQLKLKQLYVVISFSSFISKVT